MLTLISIVLASILLTAFSILVGDNDNSEVSSDGINVDLGVAEETAGDEVEAAENEEGTDEEDGQHEIKGEGLGGCANELYLLENRLPKSFPIPTCAYVRHLELVEDE